MTRNNTDSLAIGYLGSPHGIRGGLSICTYTIPFGIALEQCYIHRNEGTHPLEIIKIEQHHKKNVIYIKGVDNRTDAQALSGTTIYTDRDSFFHTHPEQIYETLCQGYEVYDSNDLHLGRLNSICFIDDLPMAQIERQPYDLKACVLPEYVEYIDHTERKLVLKPL